MKLENPLIPYLDRFDENRPYDVTEEGGLKSWLEEHPAGLNNHYMAALGMGTLVLRLGAVLQLCKRLELGDDNMDALFVRQVLDNLSEVLPSDSQWRRIWEISTDHGSSWFVPVAKSNGGRPSLLERFVTFRNRFVHGQVRLVSDHTPQLAEAGKMFREMRTLAGRFTDGGLLLKQGQYEWKQGGNTVPLHPFIQPGEQDGFPCIFHGLYGYSSDRKAALLAIANGSKMDQPDALHFEARFGPMRASINAGSGELFDHSLRLQYYQSCFVGRERERQAIMDWALSSSRESVLRVYSQAGMGKGALMADVISQLEQHELEGVRSPIPVLYHFCGSGVKNHLQAVLYHLMLQGRRLQIWDEKAANVDLAKMPRDWHEVISTFQRLLEKGFKKPRRSPTDNLVIIVDALDEAAVANPSVQLRDWFRIWNGEKSDWFPPVRVRWIFTYRVDGDGREGYFSFPPLKVCREVGHGGLGRSLVCHDLQHQAPLVQPLSGLEASAVEEALLPFGVSEEFVQAVVDRGKRQ